MLNRYVIIFLKLFTHCFLFLAPLILIKDTLISDYSFSESFKFIFFTSSLHFFFMAMAMTLFLYFSKTALLENPKQISTFTVESSVEDTLNRTNELFESLKYRSFKSGSKQNLISGTFRVSKMSFKHHFNIEVNKLSSDKSEVMIKSETTYPLAFQDKNQSFNFINELETSLRN